MRIVIIGLNYAPEPTGIAPYTSAAAQALEARGHDVTVITGYPHYPQWRIADGYQGSSCRSRIKGVDVLRLRHPVPGSGSLAKRLGMELVFGLRATFARWGRPDVVVVVSPALVSSSMAVARARLTGVPVVSWVQDIYTLSATQTRKGSPLAGLVKVVESATLRASSRVLAIHDRFANYLSNGLRVRHERIDVVRNWTHLAASPGRSAETRRRHGWADDETIVLHAGNMGSKQALEHVVQASQLAAKAGARIRFVLLGDGNRRRALEAMGGNACLQYIDPLPDDEFASTLASADILLVNELPGMTEMSVPSKLTSYFNTGLPVLAAVDWSSVTADEVDAAGAGLRVSPGDALDLYDGARQLAGAPGLRAELGAAGLRHRQQVLGEEAAFAAVEASLLRATGHAAALPEEGDASHDDPVAAPEPIRHVTPKALAREALARQDAADLPLTA